MGLGNARVEERGELGGVWGGRNKNEYELF